MSPSLLLKHLPDLQLSRLGNEGEAGLWTTSLPWPRAAASDIALTSMAGAQATHRQALGQWPGEAAGLPRRLLLFSDGGDSSPGTLTLSSGEPAAHAAEPSCRAEMELFERSPHKEYVWERHLLCLRRGENSVGLAMGLRSGEAVHWWEACRLVVLEESPQCVTVEMGGAIPAHHMRLDEFASNPGATNPYIHRHNWINGHIYARLHANGVCEIFAHHINSAYVDDGLDLENVVPVIGFCSDAGLDETSLNGLEWNGSRTTLTLGKVRFDFTEVAHLATPDQPGRLEQNGAFTVLQPYLGMELFGGAVPQERTGDPYIFRAEEQVIPRGMARTLRFSLSLSERSPRVARYVAPAWWYGACEEFWPDSLLPVVDEYESFAEHASRWVLDNAVQGGFEDGSIPRYLPEVTVSHGRTRREPGWEGEIPYALMMRAWRTGDSEEYDLALRAAYYFTDVCIDHATKAVRMHGFPPHAQSLPMSRVQACLAGYLETGDAYLLESAKAVTLRAYGIHKNSWPRMAVGRDGCFVRSAVLLYRYFANSYFREIALEACHNVIEAQHPNGSFGDQGGGAGLHQWGGYVVKPWMGVLATAGIIDYLELFPDEVKLLESVRKFADWLLAERFDHNGTMGWSYQHGFDGGRDFYDFGNARWLFLPGEDRWHQDGVGRVLTFCALRFGRPEYFEAWACSRAGIRDRSDHAVSAALQFIPWIQARMLQTRLEEDGVSTAKLDLGPASPTQARAIVPLHAQHAVTPIEAEL